MLKRLWLSERAGIGGAEQGGDCDMSECDDTKAKIMGGDMRYYTHPPITCTF